MKRIVAASTLALLTACAWSQVYTDSPDFPPIDSKFLQTDAGSSSPEGISLHNIVLDQPSGTGVSLKKGLNAVNVKLAFVMNLDEGLGDGSSDHKQGACNINGVVRYLDSVGERDTYAFDIDTFDGFASTGFRMRKRPEILVAHPMVESAKIIMDRDSGRSKMTSFFDIFVDVETPTGWSEIQDPLHFELQSTATPEPVTCAVLGAGLLGLVRRRKRS